MKILPSSQPEVKKMTYVRRLTRSSAIYKQRLDTSVVGHT